MKNHFCFKILFIYFIFNTGCVNLNAQIVDYLTQAGDYTSLYNGKIEQIYNTNIYKSLPYYNSPDFVSGDLIYKNRFYPNQSFRLNLHKEQLILLTPEGHYGVILDSKDVQKVSFHKKTFVWHEPQKISGLSSGFYIEMYKSDKIILYSKIVLNLNDNLTHFDFTSRTRYYLLREGDYYAIKNKSSYAKIFPQYKKQINQFVKDNSLNFEKKLDNDLMLLTEFCEKLLLSK